MEDPSAAAWPVGAESELPYDMMDESMIDLQMPFISDPQSSFLADPQASPLRDPQASPIQDPQASPLMLSPSATTNTAAVPTVSSSPWWSVFLAVGGLICLILCLKWLMDQSPSSLSTEGLGINTSTAASSLPSVTSALPSYTPPASFLDLDALNFI
jgi:hypothetical protein